MNLDLKLFQILNQYASQYVFIDKLAVFFVEYFQYVVVFLLFLFLLKDFKKYLKMVVTALFAAIFGRFFITEIIRYLLPRVRPFVTYHVNLLVAHNPNEPSFPSGHAAFFFALSTVVYFYNKKAGVLFFIASFLISISRVFAGIHWPSDILVGAIVGFFSGWLIFKLSQKLFKS